MTKLIDRLVEDYPGLSFRSGQQFYWSPARQRITFDQSALDNETGLWALLHELAHGVLKHQSYETDFDLLMLEVAAWDEARRLARTYGYEIDNDHIQDCLDTYRDWLDQRSTCPVCGNNSLQQNSRLYSCFNCKCEWQVSSSRFCRPYRLVKAGRSKKSLSGPNAPEATFT